MAARFFSRLSSKLQLPAAAAASCGALVVAQNDAARCDGWKFWQKKAPAAELLASSPSRKATLADLGEPMTAGGVSFPAANEAGSLKLAGCGVRAKYGIVPVYVVGLYAHPDLRVGADGDALAALRGAPSATNEFRLTLVRDVSTSTFVTALEEQVLPRAGKAETDAFSQACQAGLADTLPNKSTIVLRLKPGGTVDLLAGGAVVASVDAPKVADALLDVYVGPNAVSPAARDSICAGLKAF